MSRFNFGPLDGEPSGMRDYYAVAVDAQTKDNLVLYAVPADLQTPAYAAATIGRFNGPELTARRARTRMLREGAYLEAGVPRRVYTTAAALTNLHIASKTVLLEQLDEVQDAVAADLEAGARSVLQVGIIPAEFVSPLPDNVPPLMSFSSAADVGTFTTPKDCLW